MAETEIRPEALLTQLSHLLGQDVTVAEQLEGGRNNRVYRIACANSLHFLAKRYSDEGPGSRDRLVAEFSSLTFLWDNGVRCVPRPIAADPEIKWAVYEYIDGHQIWPGQVTDSDVDQAVAFLALLKSVKNQPGSERLPAASDACLSFQALLDTISTRLERLQAIRGENGEHNKLASFLDDEFLPCLKAVTERCEGTLRRLGWPLKSEIGPPEIAPEERTLSPSDFGFHNALRRPDGSVAFLDFEYFGWDDPAKMISDFLLHPAGHLDRGLKQRFFTESVAKFADQPDLRTRMEFVYPLCVLKWCLLLLNEFLPEYLQRRSLAKGRWLDAAQLQLEQLSRAKYMLSRVAEPYEFPY